MTAFVDPPFTVDEHAQARFKAQEVTEALAADVTDRGGRLRALTTIYMYQSLVMGVHQSLKETVKNG